MPSILAVDDDGNIRDLIRMSLHREGFTVYAAEDGLAALETMDRAKVDLAVVDLMMPRMNGYALCDEIKRYGDIPVLMLTALGSTEDIVKGFRQGADDYLVKPFEPAELVVRIQALLKRYRINASQTIELGATVIDRLRYSVAVNGAGVHVPPKEFELLFCLAGSPDRTFTRQQLVEQCWGYDYEGGERTVDVHIGRLRERLVPLGCGFAIATVHGLGYKLVVRP
ncbi:response regulator transcription factor [Paenibacillus methanolicus]|uniref:Heme response regulator HssR n=1 Tax=Paenibacillus methanolicus TaxID=582686 RepID=A0A5S5BU92_9BACL|nr:response regulator transcription factor [Paenibacillus methanolicus]TYP70741.1 DNA-binding response OmpR family regulator [Paenibacillus methanolicus]